MAQQILFLQKFNINCKKSYIPDEYIGSVIFISTGGFHQPYFVFEKNKVKDILPLYDLPFFMSGEVDNEEGYIIWRLHGRTAHCKL